MDRNRSYPASITSRIVHDIFQWCTIAFSSSYVSIVINMTWSASVLHLSLYSCIGFLRQISVSRQQPIKNKMPKKPYQVLHAVGEHLGSLHALCIIDTRGSPALDHGTHLDNTRT